MASSSSQGEGVSERSSSLVSPLSERASVAPPPAPASVASTTVSKPPPPLLRQASSIARQSSIYSLTLDEFQNALGEPGKHFGSMNMDEFLKNIWTAEESQAMAVAIGAGSDDAPHAWHAGVQRQGSISLPRTLSRKTVEDVWKDIAGVSIDMDLGSDPTSASTGQERQVTLAEMTLEDFLLKAGVAIQKENGSVGPSLGSFGMSFDKASLDNAFGSMPGDDIVDRLGHGSAFFGYKGAEDEKPDVKALPTLSLSTASIKSSIAGLDSLQMETSKHISPHPRPLDWLTNNPCRNATPHMHTHQAYGNLPQHVMEANVTKGTIGNGALMGPDLGMGVGTGGLGPCMSPLGLKAGSPSSPLSDGIGTSHASMSCLSPLSCAVDGVMGGRKRGFEGGLEKVVERRQRRMIKNRESAARSRARKQAYTVELEAEVMQLKEENLRLHMLQEEMANMRRKQFIDVLTSLGPHVARKGQTLRRTQSVPW